MRIKWGRPSLQGHGIGFDAPAATGRLSVRFGGVSTLLFDDGATSVLFDGFFSRPSLARVGLGTLSPDAERIDAGLLRLGLGAASGAGGGVGAGGGAGRLAAVVPVHSHYDHAMDSGVVAGRTGALLVGGRSTTNVGRGAGLPEQRLREVRGGDEVVAGDWTLRFVVSDHCPPDRYPGEITEPVRPPVKVGAYRCGEAWSVFVRHASGRSALVQGSAGFVPAALDGERADVAYLGIGQLGVQPLDYIADYWRHTVEAVGAQRVVLTHWDDFFRPLDQPLRALPYAGDDLDVTARLLRARAAEQGRALHFPTLWRREDPWADLRPVDRD